MDVAEANQSQVKIHRILSNTHRQASVSAPVPGSTLGWEAGGQPGQCAWLWPKICDLGGAFQGITGGLARVGVPTSASSPGSLGYACPSPCSDKHGQCWCPAPWPAACPVLTLSHPLQRVVLSFDFPFYGHPLRQITIATGGKAVSIGLGEGLEISARTSGSYLRRFSGDRVRGRVVWRDWGGTHI